MDSGAKRSKSPINYSVPYQLLGQTRPFNISPMTQMASPTYKGRLMTNVYSPTSVVNRVPSPSGHISISRNASRDRRIEPPLKEAPSSAPSNDKYKLLLNKCEELFKVNQELADRFESSCTESDTPERENLQRLRKKYQQLGSVHVDKLKQLTLDREVLKTKVTSHEEIIEQLQTQLAAKDQQIAELQKSDKQLRDLNESIKKKNYKILLAFQEGVKQKEHITQLEKRLAEAQTSMEMSFKLSQSQASQLEIEPYELKSRLSDIELQLRRKNQELELEQQKNQKLKESLIKFDQEFGSQMDKIKNENQQLKSKNLDLQRIQLDLEKQISQLVTEANQKAQRFKDQQDHSNNQIEQLLKLNDEFQIRISDLESKLDDMRTRYKHLRDKDSQNPVQKQILERKIQEQQEIIDKLQRELQEMRYINITVDDIEKQVSDQKIQIDGQRPLGENEVDDTTANQDSEKSNQSPCSEEILKQDQFQGEAPCKQVQIIQAGVRYLKQEKP